MQKIKDFIVSLDFAIIVFVLIGLRITFVGASIGDALAIISLVALKGFNNWLKSKEAEPLSEKVAKELEDIKTSMSGLMAKNLMRPQTQSTEKPSMKKFF